MDTPCAISWTGAHENFQAREYDAGASQASQRGGKRQLEKYPTQILKYLEPLMKPSSGASLVNCKWTLSDLLSSLVGRRHLW
jgi:hypothetical protein